MYLEKEKRRRGEIDWEGRGDRVEEGAAADPENGDFGLLDLKADLMEDDDLVMNLLQVEAISKKIILKETGN